MCAQSTPLARSSFLEDLPGKDAQKRGRALRFWGRAQAAGKQLGTEAATAPHREDFSSPRAEDTRGSQFCFQVRTYVTGPLQQPGGVGRCPGAPGARAESMPSCRLCATFALWFSPNYQGCKQNPAPLL